MRLLELRTNALSLLALLVLAASARAQKPGNINDHIFPAAPAARNQIDFDRRGFLIYGKRTFIVSAGMEYARVPRALWRDRLLRLKRAGFNTVEIYTFWNFHEPREGQFDFSGDHDLDSFLKLVHEMDMYAIVRVGPYYCAEWDFGGYPIWLRFKPGLLARQPNQVFQTYVDRFFDKLIPIVAANQINRGGSVILVQLENEHPDGWGTVMPNEYFTHLREKALSLGLQVPYFFSGLHHANDPAGDASSLDDPSRPNPWFSTEFWSVWFDRYGSEPTDATVFGRRAWKIIAHGGNGYNVYMGHGGSNFGYTNNSEDAASYDYGAAVGQAGDLRPTFYSFKAAAWFARSFQNILENSLDSTPSLTAKLSNSALKLTARHSPEGDILFLDNPSSSPLETGLDFSGVVPRHAQFVLAPGEILPVLSHVRLTPQVTLEWAASRILGTATAGKETTIVLYGPAGSNAELDFLSSHPLHPKVGKTAFHQFPHALQLRASFREGNPQEYSFSSGEQQIRVLAVTARRAADTWFVDVGKDTYVVSGPDYVGDAQLSGAHLRLTAERPWLAAAPSLRTFAYGPAAAPLPLVPDAAATPHPAVLPLTPWQTASGSQASAANFDDASWMQNDEPAQMGADGDLTADAWYRTTLNVTHAGSYMLHIEHGGDRATIYVDGARTATVTSHIPSFQIELSAGRHNIAIFTAHDGRDKLWNYLGPLATIDPKGLDGDAELWQDATTSQLHWQTASAAVPHESTPTPPPPSAPLWHSGTDAETAPQPSSGLAWFQTTVSPSAGCHQLLQFASPPDTTVYINGRVAGPPHRGGESFSIDLDPVLRNGSPAVVTLLVRGDGTRTTVEREIRLISYTAAYPVRGWRLHGGLPPVDSLTWQPLQRAAQFDGPQFFRSTFDAPAQQRLGSHPIWRVIPSGLGHGSVWVNGHNLGRYPEKIPINGLYIPECWLQPHNVVVIYDEDGRSPQSVSIRSEAAASRDVFEYRSR